ncbi:peroxiredoxin [Microbacterium ulmi]|uniref:Peroxiredoxin n=1 Tax=Microbacterium ulmi TaxID=179095 RepID=A0A7Y2LXE5_9MICO|nr:peroxiredoxin [Microbacterium ulmi]NII71050.1 peroxiredoxin [Microbacterium ulmi]NNH02357.1 peroxiredoxin [Microbacterium ulmi]
MTIRTGDQAPDFTLPAAAGGTLTLSDAWRGSPVVLVFFPLAFSGRCQAELCEIRDNIGVFQDAAVRVIGISVDSHHSLRAWAEQQGYGFDLVSDFWPHGEVAGAYGVFLRDRGIAARASFLIDTEGAVRWSVVTPDTTVVRPLDGYREALATL